MTLYFDNRVRLEDVSSITNAIEWHPQYPLLAVASYNIERGGCVSICDDLGELLSSVQPVYTVSSQALCLAWHPVRKTLVIGWESGQLKLWNGDRDFVTTTSPHTTPVLVLKWSKMGGRLISIDASGLMVGWRLDSRCQLVSAYQLKLASIPCDAVFRISRIGPDLTGLARRAVAGDQAALDIFSAWRPRTAGRQVTVHQDNLAVYVATAQGVVLYVNETGKSHQVLDYSGRVEKLLYHDTEDGLIIVGVGLSLSYYSAESDGTLHEITTVKLSSSGSGSVLVWAGSGTLACTVSDTTVRCWEPHSGETYALNAQLPDLTAQTITCLAYSSSKGGVLCGCTTTGNVVFWRNVAGNWDPLPPARVQGVAKSCAWGGALLAINTSTATYVMKEHNLCAAYAQGVSAVQLTASQLVVQSAAESAELTTDLQVFGVCLSRDHAAVWSSKTVAVYTLTPLSAISAIGSFGCEVETAVLYEQSLVVMGQSKLQVHTLQGTVKQTLDTDGQAICLTLTNSYLTVATINGILHLWDLSRREAKVHGRAKDLADCISDFAEVINARSNSSGTKVALSVAGASLLPLPKVYVWDMESDIVQCHSFAAQDNGVPRYVVNIFWDCEEPRLLVCETKVPVTLNNSTSVLRKVISQQPHGILVSLIASSEHGLLIQDTRTMNEEFVSLLAVDTPNYIVLSKLSNQQNIVMEKILMRDFEGLENCDAPTRSAVIKFSLSLIIGDIDHAFKAIHNIHSVAVWTSLARMCVKAQRLDVARVCLGNMKDTRGVLALRQAEQHVEHEAQVATLAVHLGMLEEAEKLYARCGRWDLLNKLLQARGKWKDAVKLAEEKDRIHLRHTCHWFGKHLETQGELDLAGEMYKRADTHRHQVPRMMLHDYSALERYITASNDQVLTKWWAQYMESTGDMESAMRHYTEAGDSLSMVRVMCFLEDYDRAAEIANSSGDRAACYHLARQYENMGRIPEAIHFFTRATAYANAIRICKEQSLDEQLWSLALAAGPREQLDAARHLALSAPDKAVLLYHRAGLLHRALDLAFRYELVEAVQLIASELNSDSDSDLLVMCANFFKDKLHFEKAVRLLAIARKYEEAISLCSQHSVSLTEELADLLSPLPGYPGRNQLLDQLAECALAQANYHLATKKYTQAGQKVKAMKALLKSGDTEKIIFFATVSRQQEIYVMAANYLQSLDWQAQPDLLKSIITFYTKGRAPHLLANFYTACAQVEVDEYGNYEKALGALNEAARCISKDADQFSQVAESVSNKIALVKKFLDIRRMFERGEGEAGLVQCQLLLNSPTDLVRSGDVYSLMIEQATKSGDWKLAAQLAQQLRRAQPHDNLALYVPRDILEKLGVSSSAQENNEDQGQETEEVVDDIT